MSSLFTRLWSSCTKSSRASLALRVFPDLTREELTELALADAYVDALDDIIDLECVDKVRGSGIRAIYVRTILLANTLLQSKESRIFLGELGSSKVFDGEYTAAKQFLQGKLVGDDAYRVLEQSYINQAYGAWFFFDYPASRRLPRDKAEALTRAGVLFRALWLVLDHLEDLEEDRRNDTMTGVRYLVDVHGEPRLVAALVSRLDSMLHESLAGIGESIYKRNLLAEYDALKAALLGETTRHE
ncbi:MAG: hypothetical protein GSR78_04420, partial [Desulfurococcales archaeon]|nr:hypothetical protein [Desulfurococcales archaeon]